MKIVQKMLTLILFGLLAVSIAACNNTGDVPTGENVGHFASYDELKDYLLDNLNSTNYYYNSGMFGDSVLESTAAFTTTMASSVPAADSTEQRDYSTTNNQVDGVEEADKILTDGYHIYIASGTTFFIVNADTLEIEFSFDIENGYFDGLYVYQDRVVLMSYDYHYFEDDKVCYYYDDGVYTTVNEVDPTDDDETTTSSVTTTADSTNMYCYYGRYTYGSSVRVFDISDIENIDMVREVYFDSASITETRMIGSQLYLIMNNYMLSYGMDEENFIPQFRDSAVSDELTDMPIDSIYFMPNDSSSYSYLMLVSMDVTNDTKAADINAYLGSTYRIYMSENNLYTTVYRWIYDEETHYYSYYTHVLRFEIVNGDLVYKAIARVNGSPLNQFSMDEYDGIFRIATTGFIYTMDGSEVTNTLYLLDATTTEQMDLVSSIDDLGKPGERIYAVRYDQDIAYVVTFVNTDPLYKLDLSDPENPEVLGELYEEGVSDYLHIITDNLMIGIGRQAEDMDGWTRFTGVKIALYDTTEDTPVNLETYLVEGEYSYTNVQWDHKAFLSFTPQDADFTYIGIPVYEYYENYWTYSQSMYLFKVYHSGDLEFVAKLSHMIEDTDGTYQYFDSIERAVIIDNYVYTLSYSSIHMFDMNNDFEVVNSQELNPTYYSYWGYPVGIWMMD
ncbi:MAG: beta-propeller domain-containing protein [Bacilli bacterium]|nr:beta-propeller domain-containing protein [Bacilli bacterium]MBN2877620.1 beta-propeller domain-containing protein [Bacilli bacterium]